MTIAERIFQIIDKKKMTQKSFAEAIGANEKTVSTWRSGRKPPIEKIVPIAQALDISVLFLLTGEESPEAELYLSREERMLLEDYRSLDGSRKANVSEYTANLAKLARLEDAEAKRQESAS